MCAQFILRTAHVHTGSTLLPTMQYGVKMPSGTRLPIATHCLHRSVVFDGQPMGIKLLFRWTDYMPYKSEHSIILCTL